MGKLRGCCDASSTDASKNCKTGYKVLVTLNYRISIAHHDDLSHQIFPSPKLAALDIDATSTRAKIAPNPGEHATFSG